VNVVWELTTSLPPIGPDMKLANGVERVQQADFQREVLRWLPHVSRYARVLTRNQSDADDLAQETFLRAYRSWHTFRPGTDHRRWLFAICRNTFLRDRERGRREVVVEDPQAEPYVTARLYRDAVDCGLDGTIDRLDLGPALERSLRSMLPEFADTVILVDLQDYTYADAASELGVPVGTVRSRLFRARRLLQEALIEYARDLGLEGGAAAARSNDGRSR
jgi:RNA polymerase sigma-70 factor (ECF subfamily)